MGASAGDVVVVSGAAGGVGSLAVQLAKRNGATVIGLASDGRREWLESHGLIQVPYGDGVVDRIRAAAGGKVDAFIDTYGPPYVEVALELGVSPERIDTIVDAQALAEHGVKGEGSEAARSRTPSVSWSRATHSARSSSSPRRTPSGPDRREAIGCRPSAQRSVVVEIRHQPHLHGERVGQRRFGDPASAPPGPQSPSSSCRASGVS